MLYRKKSVVITYVVFRFQIRLGRTEREQVCVLHFSPPVQPTVPSPFVLLQQQQQLLPQLVQELVGLARCQPLGQELPSIHGFRQRLQIDHLQFRCYKNINISIQLQNDNFIRKGYNAR